MREDIADQIEREFTYHPPKNDQAERYEKLRNAAKQFALIIAECVPECADRSAALRKIREAVMTANAGIACNE